MEWSGYHLQCSPIGECRKLLIGPVECMRDCIDECKYEKPSFPNVSESNPHGDRTTIYFLEQEKALEFANNRNC